jgi:aspartate kinase
MKVYKFGGASVKDAAGIRNLAQIVSGTDDNLVIVVSAFGKTTNALEKVLQAWIKGNIEYQQLLNEIHTYHLNVIGDLFDFGSPVYELAKQSFMNLENYLKKEKKAEYDFEYDQIVSYGEVWSTIIVSEYLKKVFNKVRWIDIRKYLLTDDRFRDANIIWNESNKRIRDVFQFSDPKIIVTQGFIGGTADGRITTLGREGSDYTAAILANMLDAESVSVWKDVPGLLNADPKWLSDAVKLDEISYKEAVEMTFSGAKVIHPKTIKPLHNKNIPLYVRSFVIPAEKGTVIKSDPEIRSVTPVFIRKEKQILLSILPKDFSFVMGENLSNIFAHFLEHKIKVNLVEASAVSLDVCVDDERPKVESLMNDLGDDFNLVYNECMEMLSIRHYDDEAIKRIVTGKEVLLEQRTRSTVRFVVRQ